MWSLLLLLLLSWSLVLVIPEANSPNIMVRISTTATPASKPPPIMSLPKLTNLSGAQQYFRLSSPLSTLRNTVKSTSKLQHWFDSPGANLAKASYVTRRSLQNFWGAVSLCSCSNWAALLFVSAFRRKHRRKTGIAQSLQESTLKLHRPVGKVRPAQTYTVYRTL